VPFSYTIREQLKQLGDSTGTTYPFSARYTYLANGTVGTSEFYTAGTPAAAKRYKYELSRGEIRCVEPAQECGFLELERECVDEHAGV
jgi:hypothetical protein